MLVREPSRSWREKTGVGKMRENTGNSGERSRRFVVFLNRCLAEREERP